jgi:hypothetical protein
LSEFPPWSFAAPKKNSIISVKKSPLLSEQENHFAKTPILKKKKY